LGESQSSWQIQTLILSSDKPAKPIGTGGLSP
jgi:hypothetical protein